MTSNTNTNTELEVPKREPTDYDGNLTVHELPHEKMIVQLIQIPYNNVMTLFIFGATFTEFIYKYDPKTKTYEVFDKYKYFFAHYFIFKFSI